jgi:hypothetical protein
MIAVKKMLTCQNCAMSMSMVVVGLSLLGVYARFPTACRKGRCDYCDGKGDACNILIYLKIKMIN